MAIQKLTVISLMIISLTFPVRAFGGNIYFKSGSEPNSYRGIKFGSNLSNLNDMELVKKGDSGDSYSINKRKGDKLKIGMAKLESIEYLFWQGKLIGVSIKNVPESNRLFCETVKAKF